MADEKETSPNFKVVDKRSFGSDGARRGDLSKEEKPLEAKRTPAREEALPSEPGDEEDSGFATLVSYLSTTAMFQLGLLQGPSGERIPADLANAHRTIDLLEVLQQKTRGNLTPEESQLLEEVIYDLRMSFVEIQKRSAAPKR